LPSIVVAAALMLFGIRQAPSDRTLFNHARDVRIALGPICATGSSRHACEAFADGLLRGLREQRELTLVDPQRVRARLRAVLGSEAPLDPRSWMRGTRSLNVLYCLAGDLDAHGSAWSGRVDVWEVASEARLHALRAEAAGVDYVSIRAAASQRAIERGVFGAPSYLYGDSLYWGQDRLDFLDRELSAEK